VIARVRGGGTTVTPFFLPSGGWLVWPGPVESAVPRVTFPVSFARIIQNSWLNGRLIMAMMVITLSIDACLYVHTAVGQADGSRGCVLRVPAYCRRGGTQLLSSRCRRLHTLGRPAESASSCRRGNTCPYLLGIGLRRVSAFPGYPASATTQSSKFESRN